MSQTPEQQEWVERAKDADILEVSQRLGAKLKRAGGEWVGPCPACGGTDRFSINPRERVFNCRGATGGDAIAMVQHVNACEFLEAVEWINGEPRPGAAQLTETEKAEREERRRRSETERAQRRAAEERQEAQRRDGEIEKCQRYLSEARAIAGTHAAAYFKARGITPSPRAVGLLKFHPAIGYWGYPSDDAPKAEQLATVPAILAPIVKPEGGLLGLHITYLDPIEPRKFAPPAPVRNKAKKVRGVPGGGVIWLSDPEADGLIIGEGIETALSADILGIGRHDDERLAVAAAYSLGNLAGPCTGTLPHPTKRRADGKPQTIINGVPDLGQPGIVLPRNVRRVILLGDGDSDRPNTLAHLLAAARRFARQGITVEVAMAPDGKDWNDVLREQMDEQAAA